VSTELINEDEHLGFYFNRFWDGEGESYQITWKGNYVQLNRTQMDALVKVYSDDIDRENTCSSCGNPKGEHSALKLRCPNPNFDDERYISQVFVSKA